MHRLIWNSKKRTYWEEKTEPQEEKRAEETVSFHLSVMYRSFENGTLADGIIVNADKTYLINYFDNERTMGFLWAMK